MDAPTTSRSAGSSISGNSMIKRLPLYQIDAFTDAMFKGNPAAVVVLDEWISNELMQQIAMENNLSET